MNLQRATTMSRVRGEGVVGQGASFCFSLPLEPVRQFGDSTPTVPPRR